MAGVLPEMRPCPTTRMRIDGVNPVRDPEQGAATEAVPIPFHNAIDVEAPARTVEDPVAGQAGVGNDRFPSWARGPTGEMQEQREKVRIRPCASHL